MELGFRRSGQDYRHAQNRFQLEFPPGPLSIGDERIDSWETQRREEALLHVISGLEQAVLVARACREDLDLGRIRDWSTREGEQRQFEEFEARLGP